MRLIFHPKNLLTVQGVVEQELDNISSIASSRPIGLVIVDRWMVMVIVESLSPFRKLELQLHIVNIKCTMHRAHVPTFP